MTTTEHSDTTTYEPFPYPETPITLIAQLRREVTDLRAEVDRLRQQTDHIADKGNGLEQALRSRRLL